MIHVDTKQLARFERVGHRITGDCRKGCSPGAGYEKAHMAVGDATRLAYVEVLPDEQKATTVGFLVRAVSWFNSQGMTCRMTTTTHAHKAWTNKGGHVSRTTAALTAPGSGGRLALRWGSKPSAQGPTGHRPTARRND
jgi:hypothetical protein